MCIPSMRAVKKKKSNSKAKLHMWFLVLVEVMFFVLPLVSAESSYIFKQNEQINLKVPILNSDNSIANSTTLCYLTVKFPNETILVNNQLMSYNVGYFNYSINPINQLGEFPTYVNCNNGVDYGFTSFSFLITPTGYNANLSQTFTMFLIIGIVLIIGIFLFIFGLKTDYIPIKVTCLSFCLLLVVFLIGYILNIANITIGEFSSLTNGFNSIYILFIGLLTVWGIGIVIYLIVVSLQAFQRTRGLRE